MRRHPPARLRAQAAVARLARWIRCERVSRALRWKGRNVDGHSARRRGSERARACRATTRHDRASALTTESRIAPPLALLPSAQHRRWLLRSRLDAFHPSGSLRCGATQRYFFFFFFFAALGAVVSAITDEAGVTGGIVGRGAAAGAGSRKAVMKCSEPTSLCAHVRGERKRMLPTKTTTMTTRQLR